jgi:hypothetical protein
MLYVEKKLQEKSLPVRKARKPCILARNIVDLTSLSAYQSKLHNLYYVKYNCLGTVELEVKNNNPTWSFESPI